MRKLARVVVTDANYGVLDIERSIVEEAGFALTVGDCRTAEEVVALCRDADGILNQYAPLGRDVLEELANCRVIARYGVGVDTIDVATATRRGIMVVNVPDYCVEEVSDHALALLLALARRIVALDGSIRRGRWDYKVARPLHRLGGRILGLVGFGRIARRLAQKAAALGLRVIACDPLVEAAAMAALGVTKVEFDELLRLADFISVHVPLSPQTRHLLGRAQFSQVKRGAVLINTSRGAVVDEKALLEALEEGRLAGAGLDVVEEEPVSPEHPFLEMENVILTPHAAWYSEEAEAELRARAARGVVEALQGKVPENLVNPEVLGRRR